MTQDRRRLYALSFAIFAVLLLAWFFSYELTRAVSAVLLPVCTVLVWLFIKKRSVLSIHKYSVLMILAMAALLYLAILYLSGAYFGYRATPSLSVRRFFLNVFPTVVNVVCIELTRRVLTAQSGRASLALAYAIGVASDLFAGAGFSELTTFPQFMNMLGMTLLPALLANVLYCYVATHYGALPNLVYRSLITAVPSLLPVESAMPDVLLSFARLIVPILLLTFIRSLYEHRIRYARSRFKWVSRLFTLVTVVFMILLVMLISGQFRFGTLVIATESMTGALDRGDAVVYEEYDGQGIETGQVIIFNQNNALTVHRVVEIERINGVTRYYTKGDANESRDDGYITASDIVGITQLKIPYVGYPTLLLRSIFK